MQKVPRDTFIKDIWKEKMVRWGKQHRQRGVRVDGDHGRACLGSSRNLRKENKRFV